MAGRNYESQAETAQDMKESCSFSRRDCVITVPTAQAFTSALSQSIAACVPPLACGICSAPSAVSMTPSRSEEHTSELQSRRDLVCRLLLEKKKVHRTLLLDD